MLTCGIVEGLDIGARVIKEILKGFAVSFISFLVLSFNNGEKK